jgi:hypothetical protein
MLEHATWLRQNPDAAPRDRTHATASHAAQAQSRGLAGFAALRSQICGVGESGAADHQAVASALPTLSEAELLAKDQAVVRAELAKYSRDPVIVGEALEDFDLLRWWQVCLVRLYPCEVLLTVSTGSQEYLSDSLSRCSRRPADASLVGADGARFFVGEGVDSDSTGKTQPQHDGNAAGAQVRLSSRPLELHVGFCRD